MPLNLLMLFPGKSGSILSSTVSDVPEGGQIVDTSKIVKQEPDLAIMQLMSVLAPKASSE